MKRGLEVCMSEVRAQIVDRLGSFKLRDGVLEVALVKFTRLKPVIGGCKEWWISFPMEGIIRQTGCF